MKLRILLGLGFLLVVVVLGFFVAVTAEPKNPNGTSPVPNAFNTIQRACELMTPVPVDFDTSQDLEALNRFLAINANALKLCEKAAGHDRSVHSPISNRWRS